MDELHIQSKDQPEYVADVALTSHVEPEPGYFADSVHISNIDPMLEDTQTKHLELASIDQLGNDVRRDTRRRLAFTALMPLVPIMPLVLLRAAMSEDAFITLCCRPLFVVAATALIGFGVPIALLRPSRGAKKAALHLSELEDINAIGGLVETLAFGHSQDPRSPVRDALIGLLGKLKSSDKDLLTPGQFAILRSTLRSSGYVTGNLFESIYSRVREHSRLQIAILKAFEQVGDSASLSIVKELAKTSRDRDVRRAAQECLPFLEMRLQDEQAVQTLVRASSQSDVQSDTLLRTSNASIIIAPDELIRPVDAPK